MTRRLEHKTALVSGSTSNIGREVAVAFGGEGAHVIVSGRDDARGHAVVARIRDAGGKADYVHADLGGAAASRALAEEAAGLLGGRIDILVNNAGIFPGHTTPTTDEDTFDRVYAVNVKSAFFLTQAVAPAMIRAGGGAIINLGSWVARLGLPVGALYSSTKGAVETLTRAWAAEFGPWASASTRSRQGSSCRRTGIRTPSTPARCSCAVPRRARPVTRLRSPPRRSISPQTRPPSSTARSSTSTGAG